MNIFDGLILTVIAMVVVFVVLGALWGVTEFVHRFSAEPEILIEEFVDLESDDEREKVAVLTALVMAYEAQPAKKFEVVEVKRIK